MKLSEKDRLCTEREQDLATWTESIQADVLQLAGVLKMSPPTELLDDPRTGLTMLDSIYEHEDVAASSAEDADWMTSRLQAYVASYLIKKYGGRWVVDRNRRSRSYARYVVALPPPSGGADVRIDVQAEVEEFLAETRGRSLLRFIMKLQKKVG